MEKTNVMDGVIDAMQLLLRDKNGTFLKMSLSNQISGPKLQELPPTSLNS
jgi:hypothetical protein